MARGKKIKIEKSNWKVVDAEDFNGVSTEDQGVEPVATEATKYPPRKKPIGPGIYLLAQAGEVMHLVKLGIESDSHKMYFVMLPHDDKKYSLGTWPGAVWFGPLDKEDIEKVLM